jgi:hypothetical protein
MPARRKKIRVDHLKNLTLDPKEQALTGIRETMPGYSPSPISLKACMERDIGSCFVLFKACQLERPIRGRNADFVETDDDLSATTGRCHTSDNVLYQIMEKCRSRLT